MCRTLNGYIQPLSTLEPHPYVLSLQVLRVFEFGNMALNVELSVRLRQILTDNNFPVAVIEKLRELRVTSCGPLATTRFGRCGRFCLPFCARARPWRVL